MKWVKTSWTYSTNNVKLKKITYGVLGIKIGQIGLNFEYFFTQSTLKPFQKTLRVGYVY